MLMNAHPLISIRTNYRSCPAIVTASNVIANQDIADLNSLLTSSSHAASLGQPGLSQSTRIMQSSTGEISVYDVDEDSEDMVHTLPQKQSTQPQPSGTGTAGSLTVFRKNMRSYQDLPSYTQSTSSSYNNNTTAATPAIQVIECMSTKDEDIYHYIGETLRSLLHPLSTTTTTTTSTASSSSVASHNTPTLPPAVAPKMSDIAVLYRANKTGQALSKYLKQHFKEIKQSKAPHTDGDDSKSQYYITLIDCPRLTCTFCLSVHVCRYD